MRLLGGGGTLLPDALNTVHFQQICGFSHPANMKRPPKNALAPTPRLGNAPLAHRLAQRPAIRWGWYTAASNAMKTAHFKKTFTDFNILPTRYDTKNLHWRLRQGQAMRLSARRPTQRPTSDWGRHTAAPNALKTRHSKQTFTDFNILPT